MAKPYDIRKRAKLFADDVLEFCRSMRRKDRAYWKMADQLNDAAGSIGANLAEAKDGETKKDFIHKNCVALKEANEAKYWLQRCWTAEKSMRSRAEPLIHEAGELIAILTAIIVKAKSNQKRGNNGGEEPKPGR